MKEMREKLDSFGDSRTGPRKVRVGVHGNYAGARGRYNCARSFG